MPVFPTTPILDDFNRPDEGSPPSSSWVDAFGWLVNGGQFTTALPPGGQFSLFGTVYGPDCEAYYSINPVVDNQLNLYIRFQPASYTGYYLAVTFSTVGNSFIEISRSDDVGVTIGLGVGVNIAIANGDSVGIRVIGNSITSWHKPLAGAWALQETVIDANYPAAGYTGVQDSGLASSWTIDNYGAGTIVGGAFPQAGVVDTFARADESMPPSSGWKDVASCRVISNQIGAYNPPLIGGLSNWANPSIGPDCEVYATIGANPADTVSIILTARFDGYTNGYFLAWTYNLAGADEITLLCLTGGASAFQAQDLAPGDKFGMQLIDNVIYVYVDVGAGWTLLFSTIDGAPYLLPGYIGVYFQDYVGRLDNFGGGAYISPGAGATGATSGSGTLAHSVDTNVYVQFGDGKECFYLGDCTVIPTLPNPATERRPVFSSIGAREHRQIGFEPGAPGSTTLAITTFVAAAANYLEQIKESGCPFNLYVLTTACGAERSINSYERAWVYRSCEITDDPIENARAIEEDKLMEHVFNVTAWNGRVAHRPITISRVATSETGDALSLGIFPPRCASDCEEAVAACQQVAVGAASVGGAIPDIYYTLDGETWLAQASQFDTNTDIVALATFQNLDGDYGILGVRDNTAGQPLRREVGVIGSSTVADVGATPNEGALKDSAAFALDARHIWICTNTGRVYFSDDGAQTWSEQTTALVASGGNALRAIHFADALVGYAVGIADTVITTTNGGETWTSIPSGLGEAWLALHVFDRQRLIIGSYSIVGSGGNVFMSYDAGANWLDVTRWLVVTGVTNGWDIRFLADGLTGYLLKNYSGAEGIVCKTINGGYDWRPLETPANVWLQSIEICQPNSGFVVGSVHDGTSFIAKISG